MAASATLQPARAAEPVTEAEAREIAVEAYLYLYPLLTMDLTRRQLTNVEAKPGAIGGPMNRFNNVLTFPPADMRVVVRPNFDTLYSSAWVDLTKEPVVLSAPDTNGRYYLLPMLDMWTDVFASPGWRTTGTAPATYLIAAPGWRPDVRDRFDEWKLPAGTQRIDAPTPYVWIIGRTKTDGPADYEAVHKIQDGYDVRLLSEWGKERKTAAAPIDPKVDMKTPPKIQVDTMPGPAYFAYGAELMKLHPAHATDQPIVARMKRIGFEAGRSFDPKAVAPAVQKALETAPRDAQALMTWKIRTLARVVNGWSMNTDTMGVYGNYYLKRAIVSQQGLGANLPEDAIYPLNLADAHGQPLRGDSAYTLHFDRADMPPVQAFWSVTLYDDQGFQVANPLNRFALSSWMPFRTNPDGSLDLLVQSENPGKDKEANWLPAPKGPFSLTMRLYAPAADALTGRWNPPPVTRVGAAPALATD
ncbi:DUF1254 domain-containing protein [Alsobacter sp. KACC 23698]|uniref:DUF1254 domain-containing protein n=1 Tax=Alsobacter sp. KACC 23698 TaxID=3149229 RepID=A0AAU7JNF8_9HYPH